MTTETDPTVVPVPDDATWMIADPATPSLVAVMVALPAETPVTTPAESTVATPGFELLHATPRSVNALPLASATATIANVLTPTPIAVDASVTFTKATGAAATTWRLADPETFPLTAVIVADPAATPVTIPELLTAATFEFVLDQFTRLPLRVWPDEFLNVTLAGTD
ncbi:MAG TPA: hypothetical protein VN650_02330 [Gemmatimonadaceae bacterium]|nr:hypothetical protein [Gemmatimonadaceae bacterium]